MSKGLRRKDLKAPDEFISLTQHALSYARENERNVTLAVLGVVAVIGIALGVRAYRDWQSAEARAALGQAYQEYAKGDGEKAAEALLAVHQNWPRTDSAILGLTFAANALVDSGKNEEAGRAFQQLLDATDEPVLRQIALYNLGILERKSGTASEATQRLQQSTGMDGPLKGAAWLALGSKGAGAAGALPESGISSDAREYFEAQSGT